MSMSLVSRLVVVLLGTSLCRCSDSGPGAEQSGGASVEAKSASQESAGTSVEGKSASQESAGTSGASGAASQESAGASGASGAASQASSGASGGGVAESPDSPPSTVEPVPPNSSSNPASLPVPTPWVSIVEPTADAVVGNPVTFVFRAGGGIDKVALFVDGLPLQDKSFSPEAGGLVHEFKGVNLVRTLELEGYDQSGALAATDRVRFVPSSGFLPPPPGFNGFVVAVINDSLLYPRDGRYRYCWRECPGSMGMLHDVYYQGELLWEGDGTCYCTGHTLEVFLEAVRRWAAVRGVDETEPFGELDFDTLRGGEFYQHWQGYGVTQEASAAAAFESADIGFSLEPAAWEQAIPGDFANLSRANGTGHAVIFVSWVRERGEIVGLTYYGCNRSANSHPSRTDPANRRGISGPSFATERFLGRGGQVLPEFLFIGRVVDPLVGY